METSRCLSKWTEQGNKPLDRKTKIALYSVCKEQNKGIEMQNRKAAYRADIENRKRKSGSESSDNKESGT